MSPAQPEWLRFNQREMDWTKFDYTMGMFERTRERRRAKPKGTTPRSDELFYDLMAKHYREIREAANEGKPFVGWTMALYTNEIFLALDLLPVQYDCIGIWLAAYTDTFDEIYGAAYEAGLKTEICSPHLLFTGLVAKKWIPAPIAIVTNSLDQCDNMSHSGCIPSRVYGVPYFLVTRPYHWGSERGIELQVNEFKDLINLLEELTSRKMDWDKLKEGIKISKQQVKLIREIHDLAMATPAPTTSRMFYNVHWVRLFFGGRPEGLHFLETLRDEMRSLVEQGKGFLPRERFRLLGGYTGPSMRAADWLEEQGAPIVAEPYYLLYPDWEVDLFKPLETLARLYYVEPYCRFYGPLSEHLDMLISDAKQSKADALIYWFNSKCRLGGCVHRIVREVMRERVGIPTFVCDVDILDPSPSAVEERLRTELGQFLQVLETSKA